MLPQWQTKDSDLFPQSKGRILSKNNKILFSPHLNRSVFFNVDRKGKILGVERKFKRLNSMALNRLM